MRFRERLKQERTKKGWSQEELAEKLHVSRQSVSKWENGQNYPNIELIIRISDLFGVTIDELLRSDEELTQKVIRDSRQLAYPRLKYTFDIIFLLGIVLFFAKLAVLLINRLTPLELPLYGGTFFWNLAPLLLALIGGTGSNALKKKYR